jgi:phosphate-selective porin OprO/OprP
MPVSDRATVSNTNHTIHWHGRIFQVYGTVEGRTSFFLRNALGALLVVGMMHPIAVAAAGDPEGASNEPAPQAQHKTFWYEDGLNLESPDGNYLAHVELRAQTRFSDFDVDADSEIGDQEREDGELKLNRARIKLGGHLFRQWLKYYTEYDFVSDTLLDLWAAPQVSEALGFRVGQYKVPYNRERFDSSGKQQFAERSIVTPPFTLDRQIGITVLGRLFSGKAIDSNYFAGVFRGNGRGGSGDDDSKSMLFGRWQWNMFRRVLPFSRSDISRHQQPTGSLAIAAASNRSAFTRFSSDGGGELPGLPKGEDGQYDVEQAMGEFAYMYRGLSIQSEYHWKQIDDRVNAAETDMTGFYFDTGYFFSELIEWVPKPLELTARYARVLPDDSQITPRQTELAFGGNWFFNGHRNKLTLDVTRLRESTDVSRSAFWGIRLQWDVSF